MKAITLASDPVQWYWQTFGELTNTDVGEHFDSSRMFNAQK